MAQVQSYRNPRMLAASQEARYPSPSAVSRRPIPPPKVSHTSSRAEQPVISGKQQSSAVPDLWATAVESLSSEDQQSLQPFKTGQESPLMVLDALQKTIDSQREQFEAHQTRVKLRGKEYVLRDVAVNTLKWIDKYKALGDVLSGMQPLYAGIPWAGFKWLMSMSIESAGCLEALFVGLEKVSWVIDRCRVYETLYLTYPELDSVQGQPKDHLATSIKQSYVYILNFFIQARNRYKPKSRWGNFRQAAFPLAKSDIEALVQHCEYGEAQVEKWTRLCHDAVDDRRLTEIRTEMSKWGSVFGQIHAYVKETNQISRQLLERIEVKRRNAILEWTSKIQYEEVHHLAKKHRTKGTCMWLLQHPEYDEWLRSEGNAFLWLRGHVGVGKTQLVSRVVDHLLSTPNIGLQTYGVAYFYIKREQDDRNNENDVLDSLIRQLAFLIDRNHLSKKLCAMYDAAEASAFKSKFTTEERRMLLAEQMRHFPRTFLIIDALDECNEQDRFSFLQVLLDSIKCSGKTTKVLISSRPDLDLDNFSFKISGCKSLAIKAKHNSADIDLHVRALLNDPPVVGWGGGWMDETLKEDIRKALVSGGEGMFQWVHLQLHELFELRSRAMVERRLRELPRLPKNLKAAYDEIFGKILKHETYSSIASRAFCWMLVSSRPMSPKVLLEAVSQDSDSESLQEVSITVDELKFACKNLIQVVNDGHHEFCQFPHLSVREYIEKEQCKTVEAHATVSKVCLNKLMGTDLAHRFQALDPTQWEEENTFWQYIAYNWPFHLNQENVLGWDKSLSKRLQKFLGEGNQSSPAYQRWADNICQWSPICISMKEHRFVHTHPDLLPSTTPIPMVVAMGLPKLLDPWWRMDSFPVTQKNSVQNTPLAIAAAKGTLQSVEFLLRRGADVNEVSGLAGTALIAACANERFEIAKLLIDHGADIDVSCRYGGSALQRACGHHSLEMARMLLKLGAAVDVVSNNNTTPLQEACRHGNLELVRLLLHHGASLTLVGSYGETALHTAARSSNNGPESIDLLLSHGADVRFVAGDCGTALHAAAQGYAPKNIEHLLQNGADPNIVAGRCGTALHRACSLTRLESVIILLRHGADPNIRDTLGHPPMYNAQKKLERGIRFDSKQPGILDEAGQMLTNDARKIIDLLRSHGARD